MRVGYLGPEGTFSEEASKDYCKRIEGKADLIPFSTIHNLLLAVDKGRLKEAIVPIENSIEGTIGIVTDTLVKDVNLRIKQEIVLPVYHYLVTQKGIKISEITDVISIPQALDQCKDFLRKKLPRAKLHLAYSTADAIRQIASSLGEKIIAHGKVKGRLFAAIGTKAAAKLYGLNILASKINAKENKTRFVVLAKSDHKPTGKDKTSVVFSISRDRPGGLYSILGEFSDQKINLTKIESRPSKKGLGDYHFFVDLEGHRNDKKVKKVLSRVKRKSSLFKLLGSYPQARK